MHGKKTATGENLCYDSIGRDEIKRFFYKDFVGAVTSVIDAAEADLKHKLDPDFNKYAHSFIPRHCRVC